MTQQYSNPPIREVICEFRFQEDGKWDGASAGLVYSVLQREFPRRIVDTGQATPSVASAEVPNLLSPGIQQLGLRVVPEQTLRFWREKDELGYFSVAPYRLAVSHFKPYPSWRNFSQLIHQGVEAYQEALGPPIVNRIGLRYVNVIDMRQSMVPLEDFFDFYPFIGDGIPQNITRFHCLIQTQFEEGRDSLVLQIANAVESERHSVEVILDLDYSLARSDNFDLAQASDWLEQAHANLENVFEGCLKDPSRLLFQ